MLYILPIIFYTIYILIIEQDNYLICILVLNFFFSLRLIQPRFKIYVQGLYVAISLFFPPFVFGFPLMLTNNLWFMLLFVGISYAYTQSVILIIMICASFVIHLLEEKNKSLQEKKDRLEMMAELSAQKFQDQLEHQAEVSILTERERIARDIHDGVGHLLSAAILQLGALKVINSNPDVEELRDSLDTLLQKSMDSMRQSVHDLYADSINFEEEMNQIMAHSAIGTFHFSNEIKKMDMNVSKLFLWIIKEAQTNTQKHSDATVLNVKLFEDNEHYSLLILDNGTTVTPHDVGLGLSNIQTRVKTLGGITNISSENGFRIFVKVPK